jgi:16S rRNA (cytosine967-C5)-methyltransferase
LNIDEEVIVQDYSSQRIQEFLQLITYNSKYITLWDCCAASGGKSIIAKDVLKNIDLTVSDVRSSILQNLKQRFSKAGIQKYHSFVADLTNAQSLIVNRQFDLIICDVPCSGSGTWSRTPEQLYFFDDKKIQEFNSLQTKIVSNTIPHLKEEGYFLYITCSVFAKENEAVVEFIHQKFPSLELIKQEVLIGYDKKADTMFAALFKKVLIPLSE